MSESRPPTDPGHLHARILDSFSRQGLLRTLGGELVHVAPGSVEIRMPYDDRITQQHGFVHAGAVSTIADTACGYAALTLMPEGASVLTAEYKVNLLAPAAGRAFVARARVLRSGRTLTVAAADVFAIPQDSGAEKMVATMLATLVLVPPRNGVV